MNILDFTYFIVVAIGLTIVWFDRKIALAEPGNKLTNTEIDSCGLKLPALL